MDRILGNGFWIVLACLLLFSPARAEIPSLEWIVQETVDTQISDPQTPRAVHAPNWAPWNGREEWHFFYVKDGSLMHRVRTAEGWQDPEALTSGATVPQVVSCAFSGAALHVFWDDSAPSQSEIRTRRWDGSAWTEEECLTCDGVASSHPSFAGDQNAGYLAWEEDSANSEIEGMSWLGDHWGPVETIAAEAQTANPSVCLIDEGDKPFVAWNDSRSGFSQIYLRGRLDGTWQNEIQVTDLSGNSRYPSTAAGYNGGDLVQYIVEIAFENAPPGGATETWVASLNPFDGVPPEVVRVSAQDGIPSSRPSLAGYGYFFDSGMFWGSSLPAFLTWTESPPFGPRVHPLAHSQAGTFQAFYEETLTEQGSVVSSVAVYRGSPFARVQAIWFEPDGSQFRLVSKTGQIRDCFMPIVDAPLALVVSPGGSPANVIRVLDDCPGGEVLEGVPLSLEFSPQLDANLTWDALQPHPNLPGLLTDSSGVAQFSIRAGGCFMSGSVNLRMNGVVVRAWNGAKSPDVNGDCWVHVDDLAYVQSKLYTLDFCADLDGSGWVEQADLEIVLAALGQGCSQVVGMEETSAAEPLQITIAPNPCRGAAHLRIAGSRGPVSVRIHDPAGRRVRDLMAGEGPGAAEFHWDGRDARGALVPSGIYFASVSDRGREVRRALVLLQE